MSTGTGQFPIAQLRRLRGGFKARDITDLLSLYGAPAMAQRAGQRRDVEHYPEVADQLRGEALTPAASRGSSEQAAKEK